MNGKALSLHFGLNRPDPAHYGPNVRALANAEDDAVAWSHLAQARGYQPSLRVASGATFTYLNTWITEAAAAHPTSVLITWAGYGSQVPVQFYEQEEPDHLDETWVMYDRQMRDDELRTLLAGFDATASVVVVSDSCHSQSILEIIESPLERDIRLGRIRPRDLSCDVTQHVFDLHGATYGTPLVRAQVPVAAEVLGLSACRDDERAFEKDGHGCFTAAVMRALNDDAFAGTYEQLISQARHLIDRQHPSLYWYGNSSALYSAEAFPRLTSPPRWSA